MQKTRQALVWLLLVTLLNATAGATVARPSVPTPNQGVLVWTVDQLDRLINAVRFSRGSRERRRLVVRAKTNALVRLSGESDADTVSPGPIGGPAKISEMINPGG